jgi:hypothetical protein
VDLAALELRHRQDAEVEDRVRALKASALSNLPFHDFAPGRYFLAARLDAVDLEERVEGVRPPAALRVAVFRVVRLF